MVWYWAGPDFTSPALPDDHGLICRALGALDFAGGTVVHINAGIAGLVGCLVIGKRTGYGKNEPMPPHSLTMTMIGASLLWVGWFGFNAGSQPRSQQARRARLHQHHAWSAAAACSHVGDHRAGHAQASRRCSARPRASSPAWSRSPRPPASPHPMTSIVLGAVASGLVFFFVTTVKNKLKYRRHARRVRRPLRRRHHRRDQHATSSPTRRWAARASWTYSDPGGRRHL